MLLLLPLPMIIMTIDVIVAGQHVDVLSVCDEPYGKVLRSIKVASLSGGVLSCTMQCLREPNCKSVVVNHVTGDCRLNQHKHPGWMDCTSPNASYVHAPPRSTMRRLCSTSNECVDVRSDCRYGACRCLPGLSFHSSSSACVEHCPGIYGNTFQADFEHVIWGFHNKTIYGTTEAECLEACVNEPTFVCRHAEYWIPEQECYLSVDTAITANLSDPGAHRYDPDYNLFHRDCA